MQKPQVNINLNLDIDRIVSEHQQVQAESYLDMVFEALQDIKEKLEVGCSAEPGTLTSKPLCTTSRHHQSVAANTRIMDAIEFINKEMRLLKGHSENGTLKVFE